MFSSEFCEISKNSFFTEPLCETASAFCPYSALLYLKPFFQKIVPWKKKLEISKIQAFIHCYFVANFVEVSKIKTHCTVYTLLAFAASKSFKKFYFFGKTSVWNFLTFLLKTSTKCQFKYCSLVRMFYRIKTDKKKNEPQEGAIQYLKWQLYILRGNVS